MLSVTSALLNIDILSPLRPFAVIQRLRRRGRAPSPEY
jgi:hypothetical protein